MLKLKKGATATLESCGKGLCSVGWCAIWGITWHPATQMLTITRVSRRMLARLSSRVCVLTLFEKFAAVAGFPSRKQSQESIVCPTDVTSDRQLLAVCAYTARGQQCTVFAARLSRFNAQTGKCVDLRSLRLRNPQARCMAFRRYRLLYRQSLRLFSTFNQ